METIFRVTGPLCGEFAGEFPAHKRLSKQWWKNGWINNGEPSDLRRHRSHYDVTNVKLYAIR